MIGRSPAAAVRPRTMCPQAESAAPQVAGKTGPHPPGAVRAPSQLDRAFLARSFSSTLSSGNTRRPSGVRVIPILTRLSGGWWVTSRSRNLTVPPTTGTRPMMPIRSVLFPAPFAPSTVTISPASTSRLTLQRLESRRRQRSGCRPQGALLGCRDVVSLWNDVFH